MATFRHVSAQFEAAHRYFTGMAFAHARVVKVRSHHEEIAVTSTVMPALSMLVPFAVALWMRIKSTQVRGSPRGKGDL